MYSKKQKLPPLSKEQIKQLRVSVLHALEESYPGMVAFHKQKVLALRVAFVLRITLNILIALLGAILAGSSVASVVPGLFLAWAFYMAMVYGGWQGCLLLLLWAGIALFDSLPVLVNFPAYHFWAVCLFAFEFLCGVAFMILGGWLCMSKKNRTYATAYANACNQAITAEQQNLLSTQGSDWMK